MPKPRNAKLETATARLKLPVRKKPYWHKISLAVHLGYRRNESVGTWSVRSSDGHGHEWVKRIGLADDFEPAAPPAVLTYWQALDAARALARRQPGEPQDETRPATVDEALTAYEADLKARAAAVYNATLPRVHLSGVLLSKPVAMLSSGELRRWRDSLLAKGLSPASVNRVRNALRAALELAARNDRRIQNQNEWRTGLEGLPDAQVARNTILDDAVVLRLIGAAYQHDRRLGVLVHVLAETGTRPGQVARARIVDLRLDPAKPILMMPKSGKGGSRRRAERKSIRYPVPITPGLAAQLAEEAAGRPDVTPLLTRDGTLGWGDHPHLFYRRPFAAVVTACGLDPATVTIYALRHSYVVRSLLAGIPLRVIAVNVDSSAAMLEKHYSAHIAEHTHELSRRALLQLPPPTTDAISIAGQ
jgi:integrase